MEIKDVICTRRKELGYSLDTLAHIIGVSKQTVQKWESGKIGTLRHSNMFALSKALGIPVELFASNTEVPGETVSARISKAIDKKGISYGELSKLTGIPKSVLHRYSTGETPKIPLDRIRLIARALDVSEAWLAGIENQDTLSAHECKVIHAYRQYPQAQPFVDKLLNLPAKKENEE